MHLRVGRKAQVYNQGYIAAGVLLGVREGDKMCCSSIVKVLVLIQCVKDLMSPSSQNNTLGKDSN